VDAALAKGVPVQHRSENYAFYLDRLSQFDTAQQASTATIHQVFAPEVKS